MSGQGKDQDKDAREARLAEALRQNLHRRKAQARQRKTVEKQNDEASGDRSDTD